MSRSRAWRRAQRDRVIEDRAERIKPRTSSIPLPIRLWQLHTEDGTPLPVYHRQEIISRQWANGEWEHLSPLLIEHPTIRYPAEDIPVEADPSEWSPNRLTPSWGMWSGWDWARKPKYEPRAGYTWKYLRDYTPTRKEFPPGRLNKQKRAVPRPSWMSEQKKWKHAGSRSGKVARARMLGFEYHVPNWPESEWEEPLISPA